MKIPTKVKYNDRLYETIELLTINGIYFLIVSCNDEILSIDVNKESDGLTFSFVIDMKGIPNLSEHILIEYVLEEIRFQLSKKEFYPKEDLKKRLLEISDYINNLGMATILKDSNEQIKQGDVNANIISLLEYFEMKLSDLNFKKPNDFRIGSSKYLKYIDEHNNVRIVEDNEKNRFAISKKNQEQVEMQGSQDITKILGVESNVGEMQPEDKKHKDADSKQLFEIIGDEMDTNISLFEEHLSVEQDSLESQIDTVDNTKKLVKSLSSSKNAAFVDTLIVSFIVGIVCGVYLTYLVLAIL